MAKASYFYGLGRRKSSTAQARVFASGSGVITVNGKTLAEYFSDSEALLYEIFEPFRVLQKTDEFDVSLLIKGGGQHSQVGAAKLAISKALGSINDDVKSTLSKSKMLKRDPREKERKKPGLKGARRAEQFSKR